MSHEDDDDEGPGNSETSSLTEPSQGTDESVQAFREQAPFIAKYIPDCLHLAFLTMLVIFFLASRLRRHPGRIRTTPGHGVLQVHAPVHGQFPRLRLAIFQMRDHGSNGESRDRARPHGFFVHRRDMPLAGMHFFPIVYSHLDLPPVYFSVPGSSLSVGRPRNTMDGALQRHHLVV